MIINNILLKNIIKQISILNHYSWWEGYVSGEGLFKLLVILLPQTKRRVIAGLAFIGYLFTIIKLGLFF